MNLHEPQSREEENQESPGGTFHRAVEDSKAMSMVLQKRKRAWDAQAGTLDGLLQYDKPQEGEKIGTVDALTFEVDDAETLDLLVREPAVHTWINETSTIGRGQESDRPSLTQRVENARDAADRASDAM